MKKIYKFNTVRSCLILWFSCLSLTVFSQSVKWDGSGDGTSWNDPNNWVGDMVPGKGALVDIPKSITLSGTVPNIPAQLKISAKSTVTLNLDLTIEADTAQQHSVALGAQTSLTVATGRTLTLKPFSTKNGVNAGMTADSASLSIGLNAVLKIDQGTTGVLLGGAHSKFDNKGSVTIASSVKTGLKTSGSATNSGTITIGSVGADGVNVAGGNFENTAGGTITVTKPFDDGIEVVGGSKFINAGMLMIAAKDTAGTSNNSIAVGSAMEVGMFENLASGDILASGGTDSVGRAISILESGVFSNAGKISVYGGNKNARLYSRGVATTNAVGGVIDLSDGKININAGSFFNNGLLLSTVSTGAGITTATVATATNNGFFNWANSNNFSGGMGTVVDKGINLKDPAETTIDAGGTCFVDIAEAVYTYSEDAEVVGTTLATGLLTFPVKSVSAATVDLTNGLPGVKITVKNICPDAVKTSSIFLQNEKIEKLAIYPNILTGSDNELRVEFPSDFLQKEKIIFEISNMAGTLQSRYEAEQTQNPIRLQVNGLAPGLYFLKTGTTARTFFGRFVVVR